MGVSPASVVLFENLIFHGRILNSLNIPLSVETVCVFTAPIFSANAAWATYLLTKVPFLARFVCVFGRIFFITLVWSIF